MVEQTYREPKRLLKRAALGAAVLLFASFLGLHWVRGTAVPACGESGFDASLDRVIKGAPHIESLEDALDVGALASCIVRERGLKPGPFYVHFLPQLDLLEKTRHAIHSPFNDIERLFTDIWLHSLTVYGREEPSWGVRPVTVHPALKLPILQILIDRLSRQKTAWEEHYEAILEAIGGMDLARLDGRARVWDVLLTAAVRHPRLGGFLSDQLQHYDVALMDTSEILFWRSLSSNPTRWRVQQLSRPQAQPGPGSMMAGLAALPHVLADYRRTVPSR